MTSQNTRQVPCVVCRGFACGFAAILRVRRIQAVSHSLSPWRGSLDAPGLIGLAAAALYGNKPKTRRVCYLVFCWLLVLEVCARGWLLSCLSFCSFSLGQAPTISDSEKGFANRAFSEQRPLASQYKSSSK